MCACGLNSPYTKTLKKAFSSSADSISSLTPSSMVVPVLVPVLPPGLVGSPRLGPVSFPLSPSELLLCAGFFSTDLRLGCRGTCSKRSNWLRQLSTYSASLSNPPFALARRAHRRIWLKFQSVAASADCGEPSQLRTAFRVFQTFLLW